ncbi:MAG TPA: histidinol dehydrogenase [Thermoanaerobaculia bacterium]|jgi:histidinol dehydrogenase|nr:histidinol dehydrogenase [Thermoanaerobaculia bacterium]
MNIVALESTEAEQILRDLERRRCEASDRASEVAKETIAGVRAYGDAYVAQQIEKFDGVSIAPEEIVMPAGEDTGRSTELDVAIDTAIDRVESFHRSQLPLGYEWTHSDTVIEHRVRPLRRVGIYVPGGRAVYISTLIMCAVPARIAGVEEIVVATTPAAAARAELQSTCRRLGISAIYRAGGAAGIAALAIGTQTLPRVDKIVGPGNAYVTAAKARLVGEVGIDMTAGPTELIVIADDSAVAEYVAADLLAQAEHGPDSAVICVCTSEAIARGIAVVLGDRAFIFTTSSIDNAIALVNRIAPEHLSIHARAAGEIAAKAENCGAIYCGPLSAPAAGDYVIGSNHVLPTAGTARFFSPLGVYDFVKRTNIIFAGEEDARAIAPVADRLAQFEGLPLHGKSVMVRSGGQPPSAVRGEDRTGEGACRPRGSIS